MKQPIFVITRKDLNSAFSYIRERAVIPHSSPSYRLYWGSLYNKDEFFDKIDNLHQDENENILVSKVMEVINSYLVPPNIKGGWRVSHDNWGLKTMKYQVSRSRRIKGDEKLYFLRKLCYN